MQDSTAEGSVVPSRQRADGPDARPLHLIVAVVAALGVACMVVSSVALATAWEPPVLWRIGLAFAVVGVSDFGVLHIRFGRETCTLTWSEAAILVSLVLTPWPWIILVCPVGVAVSELAARRPAIKIAFNAASMAVGATLATVCVQLVVGDADPGSATNIRRWIGLATATAVYFAWNTLSVALVIAAAGGMRLREVWNDGIGLKLGMLAGNTVIALLLVSVPWHGSVSVLMPFSMILLYLTYRAYHRALEDGDVWRQLDVAAKELTVLDRADVAAAAVARAVHLFNAEYAEVLLGPDEHGGRILFRHSRDGSTVHGARVELGSPEAGDAAAPAAVVAAPLAVAVDGDSAVIGVLRLAMSPSEHLSRRQRLVLRTFAHSVSTSLQNANLYAEMRHQAKVSAFEAMRDPLTGIANRRVLHAELAHAVAAAEVSGSTVGLLLIDLDHFKDINDTLGHHSGDTILCAIAARLARAVSGTDVVARLGGDEFAVVLRGLRRPADAEKVASRVLAVLAEVVEYEGLHLAVGGSIGIACYPQDGTNPEDLLRLADTALYQAKEQRGSVSRYRSDRDDNSVGRITLIAELREAISARQFVLHYQAQVDLASNRVVGAEALARWRHPLRGLLAPDHFIDLVEKSGLVHEFALLILDAAITEAALWYRRGVGVPVSVNLSARNLLDPRLPGDVAGLLMRHGLPADHLVLELTETTMISDATEVEAVLARLRRVGVQLSVDDFGTGYSSLALLQRVAVNEIKVDRSFVSAMTTSESDAAIVRATIELGHGLGVRVVAEGVETLEHVIALRALGCDVAQGWHYGKPAPGPHLRTAWLGLAEAHPRPRNPLTSRHAPAAG
jgi:diguanylate cyclase (GGDEF)-like protein